MVNSTLGSAREGEGGTIQRGTGRVHRRKTMANAEGACQIEATRGTLVDRVSERVRRLRALLRSFSRTTRFSLPIPRFGVPEIVHFRCRFTPYFLIA